MRQHHVPLFRLRLVKERARLVDAAFLSQHRQAVDVWLDHLRKGTLDDTAEVKLHGSFLERIFGDLLGYRTMGSAVAGRWDLDAEKRVLSGGAADGAIGFFETGSKARVVAPIELKGSTHFLEHAKGRSLTPIQQGWDYANNVPESRWIIVSNYRETRLYAKSRGQGAYELFLLEDLATDDGLRRFVALLGREAMLGGSSVDASPLAEMLIASEIEDREITEKLYNEYRGIRARLFQELRRTHSNIPSVDLLGHAQTILDRVLFVAFAEDRQLLPPNTLAHAYEHKDPYNPRPIWQNFLAVFRSIDKGNNALGIAAYDGGLFAHNPEIEYLELSDDICRGFNAIGAYDYAEDVSVDVLGHVFEQSVTDLEHLRIEAESCTISQPPPAALAGGTQKQPSKRKREGIFYTPDFVTNYLVRETLGRVLADAWERAGAGRATNKNGRIAGWEAYREELRRIRVLDPACGSGAFLIAAFDSLAQEFDRANRALLELRGDQQHVGDLFDLTRTVLNENLFGVDKSGESVEIAKLSLWLKTAERNKKLTFLDRNICQGNSVVSDPRFDDLAFNWGTASSVAQLAFYPGEETDAIDARWHEGFDVVLSNPPYVRHELLTQYKAHWKETFESYDGVADLFVYFFERGIQQLKPGGRLGFIVSNKWLRAGYGEKLRDLLRKKCTLDSLVDFGHAPIFPDADAFPCIVTLRKNEPPPDHAVNVTLYPREQLGKERLAGYVETHRFPVVQNKLDRKGWTLEPPGVQALLEKLRRIAVPLHEYAKVKPYYGIKTGCNEAFLIDTPTRDRLISEDPRSAEIIKPFLRGQDIKRWSPEWAGLWMIFARRGVDIDRFSAIKRHLLFFRDVLEPRPRDWDEKNQGKWAGRKPGSYKWFEIQDSVDYWHYFEQTYLAWQEINTYAAFCLCDGGIFLNNKGFFLPAASDTLSILTGYLNSPLGWWICHRILPKMIGDAVTPRGDLMVDYPIAPPSTAVRGEIADVVPRLLEITKLNQSAQRDLIAWLKAEMGIDAPGDVLSNTSALDLDAFTTQVRKRRPKAAGNLSVRDVKAMQQAWADVVPGMRERNAKAEKIEVRIADLVNEAYGLTPEEIDLMWRTAPPRMPGKRPE